MADWKEKVLHYGKRLERNQSDEKVLETLHKLQKVPMTLQILQETNIGRLVSHLKKQDGRVGEKARAVVRAWKEVVTSKSHDISDRSSGSKRKQELEEEESPPPKTHRPSKPYSIEVESRHHNGNAQHDHTRHHHHHHHHHHHSKVEDKSPEKAPPVDKKEMKKLLKKAGHSEGGLDGSVASFEACLGLNDSVQQPKLKKKVVTTPVKRPVTKSLREVKEVPQSLPSSSTSKHESSHREGSSKSKHSVPKLDEKHARKMPDALKKPNLAPLDRDEVLSTLPEIQPVYKPLPHHRFMEEGPVKTKRNLSNEEAIIFTSSRKDRTAVYSGRKNCYLPEVPTLYDACVKVLFENIDGLAYTGGVPYDILKPILERCTATQLYSLEDYNPYLLEDSDELWQLHCNRDFKGMQPEAGETWREMYLKRYDEREEKFRALTATISASMAKAVPVRQTKLAYVDSVAKPPRNVARQQAKHGTGLIASIPLIKPGERATAAPSRSLSSNSSSTSASCRPVSAPPAPPKKPKIAPLMQKTLKFMKQRFKR